MYISPEAREALLALLAQHPGRVVRIRHQGGS